MSTSPAENSCNVTNSITDSGRSSSPSSGWNGGVVILNVFSADSDSLLQWYATTLSKLLFAKSDPLAAGASDTLLLDTTKIGGGTNFKLMVTDPDTFFPVKLVNSEDLPLFGPQVYPAITVADADVSVLASAFKFYQLINARPDSSLAKEFATATQNMATNATAASTATAESNFFAGTSSFKNVTYDSYLAVSTYLRTFPFAWANFQKSYTYSVYVADDQGTRSVQLGSVTLTQSSAGASVTDASGAYTISYSGDPASMPLYFKNGQLVSDPTSDSPNITLSCNYTDKSVFTGDAKDYGTIVPVLNGTVNGQLALGIDVDQTWGDKILVGIQSFLNSYPVQLFESIANFLQCAEFAIGLFKKSKDKPMSAADVEKAIANALKQGGVPQPDELAKTQQELAQQVSTAKEVQKVELDGFNQLEALQDASNALHQESGGANNSNLENAENSLRQDGKNIQDTLENARAASSPADLDRANASLGVTKLDIAQNLAEVANVGDEATRTQLNEVQQELQQESQEARELTSEEAGGGGG
ncbi:hypothetical protein HPC49_50335, partial [Pyxidicoccus fallax]